VDQLAEWEAAAADPTDRPRTRYKLGPVWDRSRVDPLPSPAEPVPPDPPITGPDGDTLAWAFPPLAALAGELHWSLRPCGVAAPSTSAVMSFVASDRPMPVVENARQVEKARAWRNAAPRRLDLDVTRILEVGDLALVIGVWSFDGTGPDGEPVRLAARNADVCVFRQTVLGAS
jgi:hypothetical protein